MNILTQMTRSMVLLLLCLVLVLGLAWAQDDTEGEPSTAVVEVSAAEADPAPPLPEPEPVPAPEPAPEPEPTGDVPATSDSMLTMLFVIIVSPLVAGFLRRFNVANSMYQPVNALFSVGMFIAWWYFFGNAQTAGLEEWIIRGLAAAGVSGSLMSVAGRRKDVAKEFKALGSGTGSGGRK